MKELVPSGCFTKISSSNQWASAIPQSPIIENIDCLKINEVHKIVSWGESLAALIKCHHACVYKAIVGLKLNDLTEKEVDNVTAVFLCA